MIPIRTILVAAAGVVLGACADKSEGNIPMESAPKARTVVFKVSGMT